MAAFETFNRSNIEPYDLRLHLIILNVFSSLIDCMILCWPVYFIMQKTVKMIWKIHLKFWIPKLSLHADSVEEEQGSSIMVKGNFFYNFERKM